MAFLKNCYISIKDLRVKKEALFSKGLVTEGAVWVVESLISALPLGYLDTIVGSDNWVLCLQAHSVPWMVREFRS